MGRRHRRDWPGAWHHVVNRGLARRTVFENRTDMATFGDLLGRVSAAGLLEVHAYSFLTTHFHLLVRSPVGRLSSAMMDVENRYVRAFNRGRKRDGPLFRGRFWSGPIESDAYRRAVLRYIDRNPLGAGLCARSTDYPHGSAWWYAREGGPGWLRRDMVEGMVADDRGRGRFEHSLYPVETREDGGDWTAEIVERRMRGGEPGGAGRPGSDPLSDLVRASPTEVQEWMIRKARLADGTEPGCVLVSVRTMREEVELRLGDEAARTGGRSGIEGPFPSTGAMIPAMLRLYSGLTLEETAAECGMSVSTVRRRTREYVQAVLERPSCRRLAAVALKGALDREAGKGGIGGILPLRLPLIPHPPTPDLAEKDSPAP